MATVDTTLLIPRPQKLRTTSGTCDLSQLMGWATRGTVADSEALGYVVDELSDVLERRLSRKSEQQAVVILDLTSEGVTGKGGESYRLTLTPGLLHICAGTARGLYWGVQTLRQLVELASGPKLPCLTVSDWPVMGMRGFSDDMSRRQVSTLEDLEHIVRHMARLKLNLYMPYIEDIVSIDEQPMMGLGRGRLTRDEIASLVEFGRRHFVDMLPNFNSSAHQERLLERPEYSHLRFQDNLENLDPTNPETWKLLEDVYQQLFEQFPCEYFHIGLDETRGLHARPDIFVRQANRLAQMVISAGRKPIMWHEMLEPDRTSFTKHLPNILGKIDKRMVLDYWMYGEDPCFLKPMVEEGFKVIISPHINRGMCGPSDTDWRRKSTFARHSLGFPNVLGMLDTSWSLLGAGDRALNLRGLAFDSEISWHGPGPASSTGRLQRAFDLHVHGVHSRALSSSMARAIDFGQQAWYAKAAVTVPLTLAQTFGRNRAATREADTAASEARKYISAVKRFQKAAQREDELVDRVIMGLERIQVGARRVANAPRLLGSLVRCDTARMQRVLAGEKLLVAALRERWADKWLKRYKVEGLEHTDLDYRRTIAQMHTLAWETERRRKKSKELLAGRFSTVNLAPAATINSPELVAMPWGPNVFDNVPWSIVDPGTNNGLAFVATRSVKNPKVPARVSAPIGYSARTIHFLHAVHTTTGHDSKVAGTYRLLFEDGTVQEIAPRGRKDAADWWMPYGHLFGGGGAHRIDTRSCRVAWLEECEDLQGYCMYHFWKRVRYPGKVIKRIEIVSEDPRASLMVSGITLES